MDTLQQELAGLYKIAEWAIFFGHSEIMQQTLKDITEKGGAIPAESLLEQRLDFYGCKIALTSDNGRQEKLSEGLRFLDDLYKKYAQKCLSAATNWCQWVRIRQHVVMQLAILKIKSSLNMEDNDNPAEVKDITIPSSFNGKQFCEEIEAHFADHALHPLKSALRKLENQYSECFKSSIVGVFESKSYVSKIKYRLLFVMHHFNLESFRLETTAFLRSVEREVLPAPLTPSNLSVTIAAPPDQGSVQPAALPAASPSTSAPVDADAAAQYTMRKLLRTDWSEERRAAKGPYAPPPPETATPQKEKARGTKKAKSKRSRLLREIDADGDDTDEQGVEDEVRSVQKVRRNGQVQHASSEKASSAVRAANSLAANRKHFVGVMEARDPLTEALGSTVEGHDVRSAVGGWKTKTRQASAAAPGHEEGHSASKKSPGSTSKKKSLMESRAGASTVDFSDSNEDMDSDAGFQKEEDSKIAGQRSRIEVSHKATFPKKLIPSTSAEAPLPHRPVSQTARVFWTADEEDALRTAVATHGPGNWAQMLDDVSVNYRFQNRTSVNLKDKYRNMLKANVI